MMTEYSNQKVNNKECWSTSVQPIS